MLKRTAHAGTHLVERYLKSAARRRWSSATIPSTICTPIPRSLICFQTTRSTTWASTQYGSEWAVDCFEHAVARRRQWRLRLQRWLTGLRAGFVCAVGTMTAGVDEVVYEGGNCTASVLGQGLSIHETGHFIKAWCETSSHMKVERIDTSVCSGRGGLEGKI